MTEVRFFPPAAKFIKKMKDKKLKMLYHEAIDKIRADSPRKIDNVNKIV